ncbi:peroxiredoxin-5, mitochondrial [Elysia marginata]|uniref:Peroxiredoxin-5, mitochondrial n=1 Tax=Elysia marginata TaxID=1093978 RepID=A0AAV4HXV5_9GAST|nr:peroxiredoxin-5, mitochondrial [Elysia marginata]
MQTVRQIISSPVLRSSSYLSQRFLQTSSVLSMPIKVGDALPAVDLMKGTPNDKVNTSTFTKKTVIFGVPGAYTPTCSKVMAFPYLCNTVDSNRYLDQIVLKVFFYKGIG